MKEKKPDTAFQIAIFKKDIDVDVIAILVLEDGTLEANVPIQAAKWVSEMEDGWETSWKEGMEVRVDKNLLK